MTTELKKVETNERVQAARGQEKGERRAAQCGSGEGDGSISVGEKTPAVSVAASVSTRKSTVLPVNMLNELSNMRITSAGAERTNEAETGSLSEL